MAAGESGDVDDEGGWQEVRHPKKRTDHPVFRKLCIASGEVNSLSKKQIQARLKAEGLSNRYSNFVYQKANRSFKEGIDI